VEENHETYKDSWGNLAWELTMLGWVLALLSINWYFPCHINVKYPKIKFGTSSISDTSDLVSNQFHGEEPPLRNTLMSLRWWRNGHLCAELKRVPHWAVSWSRLIKSTSSQFATTKIRFNITLQPKPRFPKFSPPSGLPSKIFYAFRIYRVRTTFPSRPILLAKPPNMSYHR
jgi:hypothetical protein